MPDDRDLPQKLRWLAAFPQLVNITDPAWLDALGETQRVTIPAGTVLVRKGSPCQNFLLLYKGCVRVQRVSESGREMVLCRVGPGDISVLALMSLADGTTYPAEAIAETEVQGLCMGMPQFKKSLAGSESFRNFVLETMARRLREIFILVGDLAFQGLDNRLANRLRQLFEEGDTISLNITHEQLAMELGTTREVISRLLKEIEQKKGCIKLHRGRIELVSPACLRQCAGKGFL
jgi:CRP/FNR family transcriptional regulator